jgi:hypothetical protein
MDDDAIALRGGGGFFPGCHTHCFPNFKSRAHAAAEYAPHANSAPLRGFRESVLILIVKANPGANRNRLCRIELAGGFRRLFAQAQQTAPSKLHNSLKYHDFLVFTQSDPKPSGMSQG